MSYYVESICIYEVSIVSCRRQSLRVVGFIYLAAVSELSLGKLALYDALYWRSLSTTMVSCLISLVVGPIGPSTGTNIADKHSLGSP